MMGVYLKLGSCLLSMRRWYCHWISLDDHDVLDFTIFVQIYVLNLQSLCFGDTRTMFLSGGKIHRIDKRGKS